MHEEISERFWKKCAYAEMPHPELGTHCLEWKGDKTNGYGRVRIGSRSDNTRRRARAHRVSYEMKEGPIPEGANVTQKCHNKACVLWDNLELAGGPAAVAGSDHHKAKLTEADVQYMRSVCEASTADTLQDKKRYLMKEYSIDRPYLNDILARRAWKHC